MSIEMNSTSLKYCRRIIERAVKEMTERQGIGISTYYLADVMLKDIFQLTLTRGEDSQSGKSYSEESAS